MLANKVALITGAAQGIGLAVARLMLGHGARVNLVDVSEQVGRAACSNLQEEFNREDVIFTPTDVTDSEQLRQAFQETKDTFGGIDIVCNNAGIGDEKKWRKMIAVNMVAVIEGTFLGIEFLSSLRGGRGGVIINVSSMGGIYPMSFAPVYCASKHGVVGFSRSMVNCYLTDDVRVNCVCPEFTETRMVSDMMTSFGQLAQPVQQAKHAQQQAKQAVTSIGLLSPEKVAEGILKLATDESKVGAVMTITLKRGVDYYHLPGDQKQSKTSKL